MALSPTSSRGITSSDARLTDARTPTAHAPTHKTGGNDPLTASDVGGAVAGQTAIADLNLGSLTLLTDAITAIGTIQTKVNTLLSELRTSGLLLP